MIYNKAIGLMSGSSLDGLDIAYVHLQETGGKWTYEFVHTHCHSYTNEWVTRLSHATSLSALEYQQLHADYGHYIGAAVNAFIEEKGLHHQVHLVASHGHTSFHVPAQKMTAQLGDGAAIAAVTGLPVVSDLRAVDVALGGQGAPIVPIGEKWLLSDYAMFLNLGGIANLSANTPARYLAFDVCPANRVLNMLVQPGGKAYDEDGKMAASGTLNPGLLRSLAALDYYRQPFPKSLANDFGTQTVYPLVMEQERDINNALRTYTEHIALEICHAIDVIQTETGAQLSGQKMLMTGGGVRNGFLAGRIKALLQEKGIEAVAPDSQLIDFKEALVMALIGVLRWREKYNILSSVTGASRDSINGALWLSG